MTIDVPPQAANALSSDAATEVAESLSRQIAEHARHQPFGVVLDPGPSRVVDYAYTGTTAVDRVDRLPPG